MTATSTSTTCPLCHTPGPLVTSADGSWGCSVCHQAWDPKRLQTVAAYMDFCTRRLATRGDQEL